MVSKISNTNKSHIHIHIGDKEKKKKHRKKHGRSHGGTYISNHISMPVQPLFNRPQYLDTTLGDAREKERVRIQRGEFLPQTPTNANTTSFGDGVPANDDLAFLSRLRKGYEEKYGDTKTKPVTFENKPMDQSKARKGPFSSTPAPPPPTDQSRQGPFSSTPLRKNVEVTEPEFTHKKSNPYAHIKVEEKTVEPERKFGGGPAGGGAVGPRREAPYDKDKESNKQPTHESSSFSHQVPMSTSSENIVNSDPVPKHTEPMDIAEDPVHEPAKPVAPFVSKVDYWNKKPHEPIHVAEPPPHRVGPFSSENRVTAYVPPPVRGDGPFTSRVRFNPGEGPFTSEQSVRQGKFHKTEFRHTLSDAISKAQKEKRLPPSHVFK